MQSSRTADRRRYRRYPAPEGAQVRICTTGCEAAGFLVNISSQGAAFEYFFFDERAKEGRQIDILADHEEICLNDVPFRIAFDCGSDSTEYEPVIWRRCGIQFKALSGAQKHRLETLLRYWGFPLSPLSRSNPEPAGGILDDIFVARLKLLNVAAKAYLKGYPFGFYRQKAIVSNSGMILDQLPRQNMFRFGKSHSPLLEKHIVMLARAFSEFPVASHAPASLENSVNFIGNHLRGDKILTQMAFLKVA